MRLMIIILFITGVAATSSRALQDTSNPYPAMTYEELQAIDADTLSRSDKRLFKKALRAAKRAEKKRVAAEKKAERARLKAEKKQRKKERKQAKGNNKWIQERLDLITAVKASIRHYKDEFEAFGQFSGPLYPQNEAAIFLFMDPLRDYWDYSFLSNIQEDEQFTLEAKISLSATRIEDIYSGTGEPYRADLIRQANLYGYWDHFNRATLPGGQPATLQTGRKFLDDCTRGKCDFRENVYVSITPEMLDPVLENLEPIRLKISSSAGTYYVVSLEPAYIIGFLIGLGDQYEPARALGAKAERAASALRAKLIPVPEK